MILRVWLDRGRQYGHFAARTLSKSLFIFFRFFTYVVFHIFSGFFDLTGTFQVQPLSGKGWWYVYNFDWYPKCPKWSALNRNVSICVVPVPVFRPLHPCLSLSLVVPDECCFNLLCGEDTFSWLAAGLEESDMRATQFLALVTA